MINPKWTAVSHDYNLVTNNGETIKNANAKFLEQAKSELLGTLNTLDFEKTLVNRCILAEGIAQNRFNKGYETGKGIPQWTINLREKDPKMPVNLDDVLNTKYSDIKKEYENLLNNKPNNFESELKRLDTRLAERLILDSRGSIEFKDWDKFLDEKSAKDESMDSFDWLNRLEQYKWKIELITRKQWKNNYYVIKWTDSQLKLINQRYQNLVLEEENKGLKKENKGLKKENEELKKNSQEEGNKKPEAINQQKEDEELKKNQISGLDTSWMGKWMEDMNSKIEEIKKQNEELIKQNEELKKQNEKLSAENKGKDKTEREEENKDNENQKPNEDKSEKDKLNKIVEEQNARITYLESLLKWDKKESNEKDDEKDDVNDEDVEHIEENLLYVSRKSVEKSILKIRKEAWYPSGIIEIRWESIHVEEFEFYEELKSEYIEAKWDEKRLSELDKEFAELVILFSPIGSEEKDRYTIKLTNKELERWLYVSPERLERYGLVINFHDYYERIVEREYKEKIKIVKKIETEIKELSTTIVELTSEINIEKTSSKEILEEIRLKKERIVVLKDKLYKLLLSLKAWNGSLDNELLALRKRLEELEKELNQLKKQKKHQDEVNKRVSELEKEISDLENHDIDEEQIKKDVEKTFLKGLNLNNSLINRNQLADDISKNRYNNWLRSKNNIGIPAWNIEIRPWISTNLDEKVNQYWLKSKYEKLIKERPQQYETELKKLDTILAERIILDCFWIMEFKWDDEFLDKKPAKEESKIAFDELNKLPQYNWEIRRIRRKGKWNKLNYYIVRLTEEQKKLMKKEVEKKIKEMGLKWNNTNKINELKEDLKKLKEEQAGFDKDIDKKIADKEKELNDIKDKIREKEENSKRRIVVAEFDSGDRWKNFHDYCEKNWIKRKDGKEIPLMDGLDPSATYVDKDWRELKLEWKFWAMDDWYDEPVTYYELVYYEETESWGASELEIQLEAIIHEQEILLAELTELEIKLRNAGTSWEKIKIKERIKIINKQLTIISKKITEFTTIIREYKETITVRRYRIYSVTAFWAIPTKGLQLNSVISDMWTDVFREKAALKVEEELKRQYKSLWRWQMWSRLALFLWRWSRRKRMMKNEMNNMANTAFQTGAWYSTLNDQSQNAADRHWHELLTGMAAVNRVMTVHNVQVDQLCKDYLNGRETDASFQQKFNTIVDADANIQNALRGNNITHIWTNILLQLKEQRALNTLINTLDGQLSRYIATGNVVYRNNMQNYVEQFIKDYQKTPAFMTVFENFVKWDLNARNRLRAYLSHQKAIMRMQITNLTMNIDILNRWKSAYQIDNKDRENGWKYKLWHFLDKHPRWTAIWSAALAVWLWVATAWMSAVAWAAVTTWVFGSYVWFSNYIKKWTHHTKEQNTHEKNVVTDYRNEQAKIQNWQNTALNGRWWKKYKAKRQLALYDQTTQANIQLSNQISEYITNLSAKTWTLTPNEENFMKLNLIEWWARLKYYRAMWHNFLASERVDETEKDMRKLEKAITLWLNKIGKTTNDIENTMNATNTLGTNITYNVIQNDLKASYDKSLIQFKRERRWLALRYGIWTAVVSIGAAVGLQWLTGSGLFAKGTPWTPWTPWTPGSTTSHTWWTDNFALWKYDLPWTLSSADSGNVYATTKSVVTGAPNWSTITFNYWVGTDGTHVIPGHLNSADLTSQINTVKANINAMPWKPTAAARAQRDAFINELNSLSSSWFTNNNLGTMRAAELLEHSAQWLAESGRDDMLVGWFNRVLDASGASYDKLAERFMKCSFDITTPAIPGKPWTPPIPAKKRGRWIMWVPLFFNTFKDRKSKKDTTDQNFGGNNQNGQQHP